MKVKWILNQDGLQLINVEKCQSIYFIEAKNGNKVVYAEQVGFEKGQKGMKLGFYRSLEQIRSVMWLLLNSEEETFQMPQEDDPRLNISARGSNAGKARSNNARHGGS